MSKVTLWPSGKVIEVSSDKCLLEQLQSAEVVINSECGGHASCGKCVVKIHTGEAHLSPPEFKELKLLGNVFHLTKERLSCQTNVTGDVTIDISVHMGKKPAQSASKKSHKKSTKTHLKKSEELKAQAMELSKQQGVEEEGAQKKDENWFRHWEKGEEGEDARPKRLDGNKRPRMFKTPDADSDKIKKD